MSRVKPKVIVELTGRAAILKDVILTVYVSFQKISYEPLHEDTLPCNENAIYLHSLR